MSNNAPTGGEDPSPTNAPPPSLDAIRVAVREELRAARRREAAPQMLEVADVAEALKCSERHVQTLVHAGEIASVKIGRCRRIPADALESYVARLAREGRGR